MNVLITAAESPLGRALARGLEADYSLRLWGTGKRPDDIDGEADWITGDLRDPDAARRSVRSIDALIHLAEAPSHSPLQDERREEELLDLRTRGTHVLFSAGVESGVKRFVYRSTLEIFEAYPDDIYITEFWRPRPSPEAKQMTLYLGEVTAREFAREYMVAVTSLRLGRLVNEDEVTGEPDLMWLDYRDAVEAFRIALHREAEKEVKWNRRFAVHHICGQPVNPKYLVGADRNFALPGFQPQHNFAQAWRVGRAC